MKVGLLTCQQHAFVRTLRSTVVSCAKVENKNNTSALKNTSSAEKKTSDSLYHVVCNDSVLFPRGGGQDCDYGWLFRSEEALERSMRNVPLISNVMRNDEDAVSPSGEQKDEDVGFYVTEVERHGDCCVMTTSAPLEAGTVVWQKVDWPRRFDNMQHHTGQHLLTAVIEDVMGLPTTSVAFTFPFCYVQIDISPYLRQEEEGENFKMDSNHSLLPPGAITKDRTIAPHVLRMLEERCNEYIRDEASAVDITIYPTREDLHRAMESVAGRFRSRSIPQDVTGPLRTITLRNVDQCTCCGTHLQHLRQLQLLHVLPHQEVKNSTVKVFFVVGDRAIQYFNDMFARERQLTVQLSGCRPENFVSEIQERSKTMIQTDKKLKQVMLEIAQLQATAAITKWKNESSDSTPKVFFHFRNDGDIDYFSSFRTAMTEQGAGDLILVGGWITEAGTASKSSKNKETTEHNGDQSEKQAGQVIVMVGGGLSMMPTKTKSSKSGKGSTSTETHVDVVVDEKEQYKMQMKNRFDIICQVLQKELKDIKGGVSPQGFRGKGNLARWNEMVPAVQAALLAATN